MNKKAAIHTLLLCAALGTGLSACDEHDNVGGVITPGEVTIVVDSTFTVTGHSVRVQSMNSRNGDLLIGRLYAEGYGELDAAFTGRLMPASTLSIPDSIPLDDVSGMTLRFTFNSEGFTGDTLAPQQLSVYTLTKQLPDNIDSSFDPQGYYNENSPLGSASYTAAALGVTSGSKTTTGYVKVNLDPVFARQVVEKYRQDPAIFQWPESFAAKFPGIYVRSTFGRGLLLNFTNSEFLTIWNRKEKIKKTENGVTVTRDTLVADTTSLFSITPEVLSANLLHLTPAQSIFDRITAGECIIQSPVGYNLQIDFPAQSILDRYMRDDFNLGVINTLTFTLPVTATAADKGINPPPYLLMVKTSRLKDYFTQGNVPQTDDTDAFWATYDGDKGQYVFSNMRPYIVELMKTGKPVGEDDASFTLVPVNIVTETVGYGTNKKTVVTSCMPYISHPSFCVVDLAHSKVKFTYSRQVIR